MIGFWWNPEKLSWTDQPVRLFSLYDHNPALYSNNLTGFVDVKVGHATLGLTDMPGC